MFSYTLIDATRANFTIFGGYSQANLPSRFWISCPPHPRQRRCLPQSQRKREMLFRNLLSINPIPKPHSNVPIKTDILCTRQSFSLLPEALVQVSFNSPFSFNIDPAHWRRLLDESKHLELCQAICQIADQL